MVNGDYHIMTRRAEAHDYYRPGTYHITMHVAEGMGSPLGRVTGNPEAPDGHPDAPRVELTPVGRMVEHEILTAIPSRYPMAEVQDYVVMPDHLHFLLRVKRPLVTAAGRSTHLGHIIKGFKYGCNRHYWQMMGLPVGQKRPSETVATLGDGNGTSSVPAAPDGGVYSVPAAPDGGVYSVPAAPDGGVYSVPAAPTGGVYSVPAVSDGGVYSVPAVSDGGMPSRVPDSYPSLFAPGFCDVMPVDAEQLAIQRAYIHDNPRSRLLRTSHRDWLMPQRGAVGTALTVAALLGYLRRECAPAQAGPEALAAIAGRLLVRPAHLRSAEPAATVPADSVGGPGPFICCDSYGDRSLLERRLLPVVCHRRDKARFAEQKARCLAEAQAGAVLVSPRIAKGEQEIIDEAVNDGFPVVLVADNGFPDRYHPSAAQIGRCAAGRLLLVTPWRYRYRGKQEAITVPECKTMNCLAQALCRTRDGWWKTSASADSVGGKTPYTVSAVSDGGNQ